MLGLLPEELGSSPTPPGSTNASAHAWPGGSPPSPGPDLCWQVLKLSKFMP